MQNAVIVYNATNGAVFYNPNGSAPGFASTPDDGGLFLQLVTTSGVPSPLLSHSCFQIT
jgi:hypothetical protein